MPASNSDGLLANRAFMRAVDAARAQAEQRCSGCALAASICSRKRRPESSAILLLIESVEEDELSVGGFRFCRQYEGLHRDLCKG